MDRQGGRHTDGDTMSRAKATGTQSSAPRIADSHDLIRVHGARVNNLKDVSIEIPKRRLTVFTGVSGSGKSSLVFGTIAAESQRLINETYSAFVQGFMPTLARPEVDLLDGLTTAIIVDQERMGANPRSTVGTATDANAMLRILFSRLGQAPHRPADGLLVQRPDAQGEWRDDRRQGAGGEKTIVRNVVYLGGMCPRCEGMGSVTDFDLTALYDDSLSLSEGALTIPGYSMEGWYGRIFSGCGFFDMDKPIGKYTKKELNDLLYKEPTKIKVDGINLTYEGLIPKIQKSMLSKDLEAMQPHIRAFVERAVTFTTCPECDGTRLTKEARSSKIQGRNIADVCAMQISDLADWVRDLDEPSVAPLLAGLRHLLDSFAEIGLGYLSLDRPSGTLSGGEAQRTKMIRHLGSSLTDVTYVFDEPTIGLHPHDIERMNELAAAVARQGQHRAGRGAQARDDRDRRPRRRPRPRRRHATAASVCFEGTVEGLRDSDTIDRPPPRRPGPAQGIGALAVRAGWRSAAPRPTTSQDVDVDIPLGVLCVLTGRRRLRQELADPGLGGRPRRRRRDRPGRDPRARGAATRRPTPGCSTRSARRSRRPTGSSRRSSAPTPRAPAPAATAPASSTPTWASWPPSSRPARSARGSGSRRRCSSTLFGGKDISEVLAMPVSEAAHFFGSDEAHVPAAHKILARLADVGLGYLSLGQPLTTLSGGERQRLKLATQMAEKGDVYVLDEPTTGLHLADVEQLLGLLDRLVDSGKSVIVIEHHQAVMAHADWIIDLGPGAGHDGGRIVFEGTPADLVAARSTLTGEHLAAYVEHRGQHGRDLTGVIADGRGPPPWLADNRHYVKLQLSGTG